MANKIGFYIGIIFIAVAVILLLGNFMDDSAFPMFLAILGIISIATSKYRPLERKKKKK